MTTYRFVFTYPFNEEQTLGEGENEVTCRLHMDTIGDGKCWASFTNAPDSCITTSITGEYAGDVMVSAYPGINATNNARLHLVFRTARRLVHPGPEDRLIFVVDKPYEVKS